jgi:hypothetical protein
MPGAVAPISASIVIVGTIRIAAPERIAACSTPKSV